jgi:uncharacterized protein YcbX
LVLAFANFAAFALKLLLMHISEINIYPIKSLKGISLDSSAVERRGLEYDRRWMLVTPDGMFFTQRDFPHMSLISVQIGSGGLDVGSDRAGKIHVPCEPDKGERKRVTVWGSVCDGLIYNGVVSEWFSDAIGTDCRLVHMPDTSERHVNPLFNNGDDIVSFADGYPLLVISEASLADLNGRIAARYRDEEPPQPLPMNRFRPNLVVADAEAFAEDAWGHVRVGEGLFRTTKPCERCVVTTVDQSRGKFDGKDPLKTLATYRIAKDVMPDRYAKLGLTPNSVLFGQNLIAENPGVVIRVGDEVRPV